MYIMILPLLPISFLLVSIYGSNVFYSPLSSPGTKGGGGVKTKDKTVKSKVQKEKKNPYIIICFLNGNSVCLKDPKQ